MPEFLEDVLEVIPENEIPDSYNIVARELPETHYIYGFITTCYKRRRKNPAYDVEFYRCCTNRESGIIIVILKTGNKTFGLQPYACVGYEELLEYVLVNTEKINWAGRPLIQGILPRHYSLIESVVRRKNMEPRLYVDSTIQAISIEKALNFKLEVPDNIHIRQLTPDDIDSIYDLWPHKDVWTVDEILYAIECNLSFGIFSKETDDIQAWVMFTHYGAIGMLYSKENYRRLGYAKLLVQLMSRQLAGMSITPFASIMETNVKSISLFHSLGFEKIIDIKYYNVCDK